MAKNNPKLLLIGCGKMGGAMLKRWVNTVTPSSNIVVIEPSMQQKTILEEQYQVTLCASLNEVDTDFVPDIVLFAFKPQMMQDLLPLYKDVGGVETVFVSIAAGTTIAAIEQGIGDKAIIRVMPNLPAVIGQGVMVATSNERVSTSQTNWVDDLLKANGEVMWLEEEKLMDAVTAVSGSGPAYLFHFVEALTEAAITLGLPEDLAGKLATYTVTGSSNLLLESKEDATQLRKDVTSKGGTTEAGLEVLMQEEKGLTALLEKTTTAAAMRSKTL